jgi:adenosyl cobinamide kinase/adenosyl cobinamide phosphate guanylyltransferase
MLFLSISVVIVACLTTWLVNKWLNSVQQELNRKYQINIENHMSAEQLTMLVTKFEQHIIDLEQLKQDVTNVKNVQALKR